MRHSLCLPRIIMKYIIIKGAKSSGKSETIMTICKRLNPSLIHRLDFDDRGLPSLYAVPVTDLVGGTYIITVRKKAILLVAEAPTEQRKRITEILDAVHSSGIKLEFAIIAMCGLEKLKDFATSKELEQFGSCIYQTKIWRIPANKFKITDEWEKRISHLTSITLHYV